MNKETLNELKEKFEEGKKVYADYLVSIGEQYLNLSDELEEDNNEEDNIFQNLDVNTQFMLNMIAKVFDELATQVESAVRVEDKNIKKLLKSVENNDKQMVKLLNKELEKMEADSVSYEQTKNMISQLFDENSIETLNAVPGLKGFIVKAFGAMMDYAKLKTNEFSKIVETLDKKYLKEEELELRK